MIRSMTGFGRAEVSGERVVVSVEARSVNHRHLDVAFKMPRSLAAVEADARRLVQERIARGRVDVHVTVTPAGGQAGQQLAVDLPLARAYADLARQVADALGVGGGPDIRWVLDRPGVLRVEEAESLPAESAWALVADALAKAVGELCARRETEGEALAAELRALHQALRTEVAGMGRRAPEAVARRQERLQERLRALLADHPVDEGRVLTEVAIWAEKTDIAEELTRLAAHLEQFALMLEEGGSVGRPLDFLIQEMNREVNTIASKADDLELSQAAIAAKSILEKIREQVQNLE